MIGPRATENDNTRRRVEPFHTGPVNDR